jgi:hypothetical protein
MYNHLFINIIGIVFKFFFDVYIDGPNWDKFQEVAPGRPAFDKSLSNFDQNILLVNVQYYCQLICHYNCNCKSQLSALIGTSSILTGPLAGLTHGIYHFH